MKLFAHRGNLYGLSSDENKITHIEKALTAGYCVEVDVFAIDKKLYLGHDKPEQEIYREFLEDERLLVHCKNFDAFHYLFPFKNIHCFYQEHDEIAISNRGYKIHHEKCKEAGDDDKSILINLSGDCIDTFGGCYGIVSDYVGKYYEKDKEDLFKLLILDVDGVLTDGTKTYNEKHQVISKNFCDRDFTAIKRFKSAGIKVCLLTGCDFNHGMSMQRNLAYFDARKYSGKLDKTSAIPAIGEYFGLKIEQMAYVGDDYYDCSLLDILNWSYAPQNAAQCAKDSAKEILACNGGQGVIECLYESVKHQLNQRFPYEA